MDKKPIIGISGSIMHLEKGLFAGYQRAVISQNYIDSIIEAGGIPYVIPFNTDTEVIKEQTKHIDALVLSGGHDVFPLNYGEEPKPKLNETSPERDYFDITLLSNAVSNKKPILGICRGLQIINIGNGGTLYQDLSYNPDIYVKHIQSTKGNIPTHTISIEKGSFLESVYESNEAIVNSFHHQMINKLANGFNITAKSKDGVIEAIEKIDDNHFIVSVQWHPEAMTITDKFSKKLFKRFVEVVNEKNISK